MTTETELLKELKMQLKRIYKINNFKNNINMKEISFSELKSINGGETGDFAYAVAKWCVHYAISEMTGGLSNIYLLIKNCK